MSLISKVGVAVSGTSVRPCVPGASRVCPGVFLPSLTGCERCAVVGGDVCVSGFGWSGLGVRVWSGA